MFSFSNSFLLNQMRPKKRNNFIIVFILGCIIFVFLLAYIAYADTHTIPGETLVQIHVLFRHGERTPTYIYPADPYIDHHWADGLGSLTNEGKLRMYNFGETFSKRYRHFLGELFFTKDVSIQSSASPRCQMSAMTFFAGLFPPVGSQIWKKDLHWQPILVNPIPREMDNLIASKAPCNAFDIEKVKSDDVLNSRLTDKERNLFKYLSEHTGSFVNNIEGVEKLYSTLTIEEHNGLQLPDWTTSVYPEPMKTLASMNMASYTYTPTLKRLQGGPLMKEWLNNMKSVDKKAHFYSGHDMTLVKMMRILGFEDAFLPDYGATLVLELHLIKDEKIIKALYYNSSRSTEPVSLTLPSCESNHCLLETMEKQLKPFIPDDWERECNSLM